MHNCFTVPPHLRCGYCRELAATRRRLAVNAIRAAAWDRAVSDDEWCALFTSYGIDVTAMFLETS